MDSHLSQESCPKMALLELWAARKRAVPPSDEQAMRLYVSRYYYR